MNLIKKLREQAAFTQMGLAEKTGLSLRTIQRLETESKAPKGHSLAMLAKVFGMEASQLQADFISQQAHTESDKLSLKLINLSSLAFFLFPFGNVIFPYVIWKKKNTSAPANEAAKRIINFQIIWTVVLCSLLCISPFIDPGPPSSFPLILIVLFLALASNLLVVCLTAHAIHQDKLNFLHLPLRLL